MIYLNNISGFVACSFNETFLKKYYVTEIELLYKINHSIETINRTKICTLKKNKDFLTISIVYGLISLHSLLISS